jgi:hypothetical protein
MNQTGAEKSSLCILGGQSVKKADTAQVKGFDRGRKVSGIKRHPGVITQEQECLRMGPAVKSNASRN